MLWMPSRFTLIASHVKKHLIQMRLAKGVYYLHLMQNTVCLLNVFKSKLEQHDDCLQNNLMSRYMYINGNMVEDL